MNATESTLTPEQVVTCLAALESSLSIWEDGLRARERNPKYPHPFSKEYVQDKVQRIKDAIQALESL